MTGAVVVDQLVWVEDVRADLAAPGDLTLLAVDALHLAGLLVFLDLVEFRLEEFESQVAVLVLAALGAAADLDPGRQVFEVHGGLDLVDVLSALAAAAGGGDLDVLVVDLDGDVVVDLRDDVEAGERGLAPRLGVEGGDAHQAVDSVFVLEIAVSIFADDLQRRVADAGLVVLLDVD